MKYVNQPEEDGCGIACVAMICNKTFDEVLKMTKTKLGKTGALTYIKDLEELLDEYGVESEREKFKSWDGLNGIYIVGVNETKNKHGKRATWHWVVVLKNTQKFLILDPNVNECINYGDCWAEEEDGYIARKNCTIIKCTNIRFPSSIKI